LRAANDVLNRRGVFEHHEVSVMLGHRDTKLGDCSATIRKKARAKCRIYPSLGDHPGAIPWYPLLLREMVKLLNSFRHVYAARVERCLYGFNTLFRRGCGI